MEVGESSMQGTDSMMHENVGFSGTVSMKKGDELVDICKEIVSVLKAICFLCVCINLCVHLSK